jgi:hypothetical protein
MHDVAIRSQTSSRNFILIAGLLLYCGAFAILLGNQSFEIAGAVIVLVVFGIVLPLIAWITTRHAVALPISIQPGRSELIVLTAYVIALSVYLIGGPQWIDQHLPSAWIESQRIKFVITLAKKLFVFDFSLRIWLSTPRFRHSARGLACALPESLACRARSGRGIPGFSIFSQRRRRCLSA